jgi:speckle-type POZ protein
VLDAKFHNYSTLTKVVNEAACSPTVELGIYMWAVKIYPAGYKDGVGHVSCYLSNCNECEVTVSATIHLITSGGISYFTRKSHAENIAKGYGTGFRCMISQQKLMAESGSLLAKDMLRMRVEIHSVSSNQTCVTHLQDSLHVYPAFNTSPFVESGIESRGTIYPCDVYILTASRANGSVEAHKYVLALRSPVFRAMFKTGMKETSAYTIAITDFPDPVVRAFGSFLYEDRCSRSVLQEHAAELSAIADKYQVPALTAVCERFLMEALCPANG